MRLTYCRVIGAQIRDLAIFTVVLILLGLFVASLAGCTTQHTDPVTGAVTTQPVDPADVAQEVGDIVQNTASAFGPWGYVVAAVAGAVTPIIVGRLRKKKPQTP